MSEPPLADDQARLSIGGVYGYEGLERRLRSMQMAFLSARQILENLLVAVPGFSAGLRQQDDMAVIVVKAKNA